MFRYGLSASTGILFAMSGSVSRLTRFFPTTLLAVTLGSTTLSSSLE